jgi:hypothetical protein
VVYVLDRVRGAERLDLIGQFWNARPTFWFGGLVRQPGLELVPNGSERV